MLPDGALSARRRAVDETEGFDAIILAGGASRRVGGADKAEIRLGGKRLLDRVLEAVVGARRVVVVGPRRAAPRGIEWAVERPAGGGPAAALGAGLELVTAPVVVVLAVDLPFLEAPLIEELVEAAEGRDGAVLTDRAGAPQYLAAAYDTAVLRAATAPMDSLVGVPLRSLVGDLDVARLPGELAAGDVDYWDEIDAAQRWFDGRQGGAKDAR
jgi:molybdopterin-guanine dinucleotide biosynthesis protein A